MIAAPLRAAAKVLPHGSAVACTSCATRSRTPDGGTAMSCLPSSPPSSPRIMPKPLGAQWQRVADQLCPKLAKLAAFLDEAETDVLAYMSLPAQHRAKLHSINPLEIKRRTEVVGIFPSQGSDNPSGRRNPNRTTSGRASADATCRNNRPVGR